MFQFVQEARDQTQPGSLFSRSGGRGEREPGNEVGDMQVFNWVDSANVLHVFTYTAFVTKLRYHLSTLGLDPRSYAGHSFCRGEHHLRTNRASLSN